MTRPSASWCALTLGAAAILASCSPAASELADSPTAVPTQLESSTPTPLPTPTPAPTATPAPTPTPTSVPVPPVLITTTGVPVLVTGTSADGGYTVTTPCGRDATVPATGTPLYHATVVIDPGHGGTVDTGAIGPDGVYERDLNMRVAQALVAELTDRGIRVALTRTAGYAEILATRAAIADALGATLMVSIHHNAPTPGTSTHPGTEVFVQSASAESQRLGAVLYDNVRDALSQFDITWHAAPDAGPMTVTEPNGDESYGMIGRPHTPTALIELGYLSSASEAALFETDDYLRVASTALADAITAYLDGATSATPIGHRTFVAGLAPGTSQCADPALQ